MTPLLKYDPLNTEVMHDPYPTYRALREHGPLARGGPAQWVVTRYRDVSKLVNDRRLGAEVPPEYHEIAVGKGVTAEFRKRIVLDRDPPAHTRLRSLMSQAFTPSFVHGLAPHIQSVVDGLVEPLLERGGFDAVADLAFPLPVIVLCEVLGVPASDRELVRPYALALSKAFSFHLPEEDREACNRAVLWLQQYISALLADRRDRPGSDLLSRLMSARDGDDALTVGEIVDNAVFLFFAGFETTTNMISTGCEALSRHPDQFRVLHETPALAPSAIDEFLRYDAPVQLKGRMVRGEIVVGGRTIRPGRILMLLLGSANRDPDQFTDPDRLDVTRRPNRHLAFGGGIHHCLGAALARAEGVAVFTRLARSVRTLELAGPSVRRLSASFRAHESVPIALACA